MQPRLLLADDHSFILAGIRSLLEPHYDLVGQVSDGRSLVEAALRLRPDLTILDVTMPLLNGIDAARQIKKEWPQAKLLFLTMHASAVYLREAVAAGGLGYVLKSSATEELRTAIQKVLKGHVYLAPSFDREVLETVHASLRKPGKSSVQLTGRQREVLQLIAEGRVNKEIATILGISVKTVEFHRGRIMGKLGAHSMADLIRWAVQAGLVGE
ncbi:MAG TPA: response regulator [Candidatus Acidoferrales bacterium]|jgi:DNA-binding NarL/FixJ family response regulator|nr:response regulator [Candidatus Acidoferrales bacterium]